MRVRLVALDQLPFNIQARNHTGGRFSAYPWQGVVAIMAQLARCTPPSAVAPNLCDAAHLLAPGMPFREPSLDFVMKTRATLGLAGETIAAFRFAAATRVLSFGYDESTKLHVGVLSTNAQLDMSDGTVVDVLLRGVAENSGRHRCPQVVEALQTK